MEKEVLQLLEEALNLKGRSASMTASTKLLGHLPELDSLAVASLLTRLEERFKIRIEDDEIDGSVFATVGSLAAFIEKKMKS